MEITISRLKELAGDRFYYLASPYSDPDPTVQGRRTSEVHLSMGWMMSQGLVVYSPIWACHHASLDHKLPGDAQFWKSFNDAFLYPSAGVIVVMLDGWSQSKGVTLELAKADEWAKPSYLFHPTTKAFKKIG